MSTTSQVFSELYDKVIVKFQNSVLRSNSFPDLSANDEHYIDILYSLKNPTLTTFSEKAKISKPASTRIIQSFLERGFLTKNPSATDKRVQYLELNLRLKEHCRKNYLLFDSVFSDCIAVLEDNEKKELHYLLNKINQEI